MPSRVCPICRAIIPANAYTVHRRQQHGTRNGSTSAWRRLRSQILARDRYRCTGCGSTAQLEVHHVGWDNRDDAPSNLTTLCTDCHHALHD